MRTTKIKVHPNRYLAVFIRALGAWTVIKITNKGVESKRFKPLWAFNTQFNKAITHMRKEVKIPASGWKSSRVKAQSFSHLLNQIK